MPRLYEESLPPLRDRIAPGVRVLFVGINPGVRSALTGHHFAGFSNRFWKLLYESRLVPERLTYEHDDRLPEFHFGITNIVARPSPGIDTLKPEEYLAGRARLRSKVRRYRPAVVALVVRLNAELEYFVFQIMDDLIHRSRVNRTGGNIHHSMAPWHIETHGDIISIAPYHQLHPSAITESLRRRYYGRHWDTGQRRILSQRSPDCASL